MDTVIADKITLGEAYEKLKKGFDEVSGLWEKMSDGEKIKYCNSCYTYEQIKADMAKGETEEKCDAFVDKFLEEEEEKKDD